MSTFNNKLLLKTDFYEEGLLDQAIKDFSQEARITRKKLGEAVELVFESKKENTHLEFANHLIALKKDKTK